MARNMLMISFILICVAQFPSTTKANCHAPPPSSNFTLERYYGLWYEIGKIQTKGGAFFESGCVCTTIEVEPKKDAEATGDSTALNSCRKPTPQGKYSNATGQLINMGKPGQWQEKFFVFAPAVNYTVIYLDDEFAVEYDCGVSFGLFTNYCIHIMSRSQTPDPALVKNLITFSIGLGLNSENLDFQWTEQATCW